MNEVRSTHPYSEERSLQRPRAPQPPPHAPAEELRLSVPGAAVLGHAGQESPLDLQEQVSHYCSEHDSGGLPAPGPAGGADTAGGERGPPGGPLLPGCKCPWSAPNLDFYHKG
ncbi:hypothetical protein GWK47_033394 [Chionoecetes opilio]|uniref:Uncharacterized protein n=1 Tax=Chionoecetes opilio TaxID=41210 RepID=A0A8J5D0C1_CHIOP|nr:hypothetical protein GWK47_033394 [Chionoecetes opilio]